MRPLSNTVGTMVYEGVSISFVWVANTNGEYNDNLASAMSQLHTIASSMEEPNFISVYPTDQREYNEYIVLYEVWDTDHIGNVVNTEELYKLIEA